jgi:hypothetical protein
MITMSQQELGRLRVLQQLVQGALSRTEAAAVLRTLQAFVIHDEALDQIFLEMSGGPLAELRTAG